MLPRDPQQRRRAGARATGHSECPSWYAGAGALAARPVGPLVVDAELALYRFRGLDRQAAWVGEGRIQGLWDLPLGSSPISAQLAVRLAAGTDRLLAPWGRAGLAVVGTYGNAGRGGG